MISTHLVNSLYGKWNAVLVKKDGDLLVFAVDALIFFPETLSEWIDTIRKIEISGELFPLRMDIDITNYCNNDCVMCFSSELRHERLSYIPYSRLIQIFDEFKERGGKSIRLTGGGDCLTHPDFVNIINYLDRLNIKISIQTNGDNLWRAPIQDVISEKVHSLRVSVNSSNNETRHHVHRAKNRKWTYDNLVDNMSTVISKAREYGRENELMPGATFVVLPENYLGVRKFINDMYAIGVRWIAIRKNIHRDIYEKNPNILPYVENQLKDLSAYPDLTLVGQYNVSFGPARDFDKCWVSYVRPIVLADSSLHLCCMTRNNTIPEAEIGFLLDENFPFQNTLETNRERLSDFRISVPRACKVCIDPTTNIFIGQVKQLLDEYQDPSFYKANIKVSSETSWSYDHETELYQVALSQSQYNGFQNGGFVSLQTD